MKILYSSYTKQRYYSFFCGNKKPPSQAQKIGVVEEESRDAFGRSNHSSCLLLKHIDCIFVFHFQLLKKKRGWTSAVGHHAVCMFRKTNKPLLKVASDRFAQRYSSVQTHKRNLQL